MIEVKSEKGVGADERPNQNAGDASKSETARPQSAHVQTSDKPYRPYSPGNAPSSEASALKVAETTGDTESPTIKPTSNSVPTPAKT